MNAGKDTPSCSVGLREIRAVAEKHKDIDQLQCLLQEEKYVNLEAIDKGDVNFNFRCTSTSNTGAGSLFIKYTPPFCKSAPQIALSTNRLATEFTSMCLCDQANPGSVPKPLCYDPDANIAFFEFLEGFVDYEKSVVEGRVNQQTVTALAKGLGKLHHSTHKNTLPEEQFADLKAKIGNGAEDVSDFYYNTGYSDESSLSELKPEHRKLSEQFRNDPTMMSALQQVKQNLDREDCLIHGDLHFNSVMVKDNVPKMIDFEFASIGHPARDIGMVLAQTLAIYYFHMLNPDNNDQHRRIAYKLQESCNWFMQTYYDHMTAYTESEVEYKRQMASHVTGVVGAELCARVLQVPHIPGIQSASHVASVETEMLHCGMRLLKKQDQIDSINKMVFIGLQLC